MKKRFAVLGGDQRQIHLSRIMDSAGWDTVTWGLEKGGAPFGVPLDRALNADIIVLPLPVCRGNQLNLPLSDTELSFDALWGKLRADQIVLGGNVAALASYLGEKHAPKIWDYYDREEVQVANAALTAEGALMRAMEETAHSILGSRCLVIGYGRIGKLLLYRLCAMGAQVTVAARKRSDLSWIETYGGKAMEIDQLSEHMGNFDLIFNTSPAQVLDSNAMRFVRPDCLMMELASVPGGFDLDAVKDYNLQLVVERGLPGKVAPVSAARVIFDGIRNLLAEKGVSI